MVKEGCSVAIKMEPLRYLYAISMARVEGVSLLPNCKCSAISRWCQCCNGIENGSRGEMFGGGGLEQDDVPLSVSFPLR